MKKLSKMMMCLFVMMAASMSAKAQEITINLMPGWTWISYTKAEPMNIATALGDFIPSEGDVINSQYGSTSYHNGNWRGSLQQFTPGVGYMYYSNSSESVSFVFASTALPFTVTTNAPTSITTTTAVVGGIVTVGEDNHIYARGVCWDTIQTPTILGSHTSDEAVSGSLSDTLDGLTPGTTYYVRAYAVTDYGLAYGEELSFTTQRWANGVLPGAFSVSENQQVFFSQGNLQYIGSDSTPYWKFADNQWDCLGVTTGQNSSDPNVDRDLFGWSTSGYNHGANCYQPWSTSENTSDYYAYGQYYNNLYDQTGQADWGYNPISNGGNQENQWHTLSRAEWAFVIDTRSTTSGIRYAKATINNVKGVILLPDDWSASTYSLNDTNTNDASFSSNVITDVDWIILEQAGAVFLPVTGGRYGTSVRYVDIGGYYWSGSYINSSRSCVVNFTDTSLGSQYANNRYDGFSVRLARGVQ